MNPLTNIKNQQKLNQRELELGLTGKKSWHDQYKDSAWIFIAGLPYDLTEGDIICVFSQYGEIVNINLVRDQKTGKSKGFGFICYEDQRSTVLTVDNLNAIKLLGRTIRVDHVEEYRIPKDHGDEDEVTQKLRTEGCAPKIKELPEEEDELILPIKVKKEKKKKKEKKEKKKKKRKDSSSGSDDSSDNNRGNQKGKVTVKKEKFDPGYEKASGNQTGDTHKDRGEKPNRDSDDRKNVSSSDRFRASDIDGTKERSREAERDTFRREDRRKDNDRHSDSAVGKGRTSGPSRDESDPRSREREIDRYSKSNSEKSRDRVTQKSTDRDRSWDRVRDRQRSRSRDRQRDRFHERQRSRSRDRHRDRSRERERSPNRYRDRPYRR